MNDLNRQFHSEDARWQAVCSRDAAADDHFVYAVRSTRLYGRPSAVGRVPRRDNVEFFGSAEAAEAAGYRPNRRAGKAQELRQRQARITAACRAIETAETPPSLLSLAAAAGLSPYHFHRLFKAETGLTPKAYADAQRARRLRDRLQAEPASITAAIYDAGFNASSRFYETAGQRLGMPARDFLAGGRGREIRFAIGQCALGAILVAASERGICAILLGDDPERLLHDLQDRFPQARLRGGEAAFEDWVARVVGFVEAPALGLNLPLDLQGTAFQERVWRALQQIPVGQTVSYRDIAERIGAPRAVRAVAQACAANPLAVAIPCHRVVRRDGGLSGYRWGVERKRALLLREQGRSAGALTLRG